MFSVYKFPMRSHIYVFFLLCPLLLFIDVCVFFAKNVETVDWADTEPEFTLSTHWIIQVKYEVRSLKFIWAPCVQLYSLAETLQPSPPPHLGSHTCALRISQDRRHLFVTPCIRCVVINTFFREEIILLLYFVAAT
jgi:hypothetical protein